MSIFICLRDALICIIVAVGLIQIDFSIIDTIGYMIGLASVVMLIVPAYVMVRTLINNKGFQFKVWKPSMRKIGYIIVAVIGYVTMTDSDISTWWSKLISLSLILTAIYAFLFINTKEEEYEMYDKILGDIINDDDDKKES